MNKTNNFLVIVAVGFALTMSPGISIAQGKGGGKGHGGGQSHEPQGTAKGKSQGKAGSPGRAAKGVSRGRSDEAHLTRSAAKEQSNVARSRGNSDSKRNFGRFARAASVSSMPVAMRHYASSAHRMHVVAAGAVAHAFARDHQNDFRIDDSGNRVRILNGRGAPLVDLDDRSANDLGRWRVGVLDDDVREGAPSFCRSGAGHPVWGREWCIDKGFGLGSYDDYRWGRTTDIGSIIFPRSGIASALTTVALASLLGSNTFNRLALHCSHSGTGRATNRTMGFTADWTTGAVRGLGTISRR